MTQLLTPIEVAIRTIRSLGLDPSTTGMSDPVVVAALVRRAAAFLAPCSPRALRERVLAGVRGLSEHAVAGDDIDEMINSLVSYGDLLELPAREGEGSGAVLYLAQPAFVQRPSGTVFILGIPPDGRSLLPSAVGARVRCRMHTRRIEAEPGENLAGVLRNLGLQELPEKLWWRRPRPESADSLLAKYDERLTSAARAGEAEGLQVLDSERPVTYYKGRWVPPGRLSGRFVARREQRYGAPLWSYVELQQGQSVKLYDIPPDEWRACDHAWQLQLAIDHRKGHPQLFRVHEQGKGRIAASFFSPLPRWIQMRWDLIGEPQQEKGALFSYVLPSIEYESERLALTRDSWMREITVGNQQEIQ